MNKPTALRIAGITDPNELLNACKEAVSAGFDGVELAVAASLVEPETTGQLAALKLFTGSTGRDLRVVAIAATCPTTDLHAAVESVTAMLRQAGRLEARCLNLTIPPIRPAKSDDGFSRYQDAREFAYGLLYRVRFEAEAAGAPIALEAGDGDVLTSPVELREIIDAANSWAVGVCVDVGRVARIGVAEDWITTLHRRIHAVRLRETVLAGTAPAREDPTSVDLLALADALAQVPAERPLIAAGRSPAADLRARLADLECPTPTG